MPCSAEQARENGKKGGRPRLEATKLREATIRAAEENAEKIVAVFMEQVLEGNIQAIKEFYDRGLGKALQNVDVTTAGKELPTPILGGITKQDDANNEKGQEGEDS